MALNGASAESKEVTEPGGGPVELPAHAPIRHNAGPPLEPEKPRQPIPGVRPAVATNGRANLTADAVNCPFREYKLKLEVKRVLRRKIVQ